MSRFVPEWIGRTPDSRPPAHVRMRIFDRHSGNCFLSSLEIAGKRWDLHHIKALAEGGENRESNLAPVLVEPHQLETRKQIERIRKADRVRERHVGAVRPKGLIPNRGFWKLKKEARVDRLRAPGVPGFMRQVVEVSPELQSD